ncbi:hypothetical protein GCM10010400_49210 [Streptomyces aculeolatus]
MTASRGQAVDATRQRGRDPQDLTGGIGDDPDVHTVPAALGRAVGQTATDTVTLGEGPVQQDELRIMLAQRLEQAPGVPGRPAGRSQR